MASFLLFALARSEKTFCETPTSWEPTAPFEQLRLTLEWKTKANQTPWWVESMSTQFSIKGGAVDGGPLCDFANSLPSQVSWIARFLICEDCSEGCDISCYPEKQGAYDRCHISLNSNCVHLEGDVPEDVQATWSRTVDPWRIGLAIFGAVMVLFASPLSQSTIVHMTTGAVLSVSLGVVLLAWWSYRQARSTLPFARYYLALMNFMLVLAPSIGFYLFHTLTPSTAMALHAFQKFFMFQEPYFGVPVGSLTVFTFVSFGCYLGKRLFGGENFFEESDGARTEVKFSIGRYGQRLDRVPNVSNAQVGLEWTMWSLGLIMMLRCSSVRALNLAWIVFILTFRTLRHWWLLVTMYQASRKMTPKMLNKSLLSHDDLTRQSKLSTEQELTKLRNHLKENGVKYFSAMGNQDMELKLRRFCEGGSHVDSVPSFEWTNEDKRRCTMM